MAKLVTSDQFVAGTREAGKFEPLLNCGRDGRQSADAMISPLEDLVRKTFEGQRDGVVCVPT